MKKLLIILSIGLFACGRTSPYKKDSVDNVKKVEIKTLSLPAVGEKIEGDFKGDGQIYIATVIQTKAGQGNPIEDGTANEYEIRFSGNLKSISAGCCEIRLINEGDLNNDGTDEISVFQAPMNGCTYSMTTYTLVNEVWQQIVPTFLIPTDCEKVSNNDLQKRIFRENNTIYFLETDMNSEDGKLIKKSVMAYKN